MKKLLCISISLIFMALIFTGCKKPVHSLDNYEQEVLRQINSPDIKIIQIAFLTHDLGERFEENGDFKSAFKYYSKAKWAFELSEKLTRNRHPLQDDTYESLERLKGKEEAGQDLKFIRK